MKKIIALILVGMLSFMGCAFALDIGMDVDSGGGNIDLGINGYTAGGAFTVTIDGTNINSALNNIQTRLDAPSYSFTDSTLKWFVAGAIDYLIWVTGSHEGADTWTPVQKDIGFQLFRFFTPRYETERVRMDVKFLYDEIETIKNMKQAEDPTFCETFSNKMIFEKNYTHVECGSIAYTKILDR